MLVREHKMSARIFQHNNDGTNDMQRVDEIIDLNGS